MEKGTGLGPGDEFPNYHHRGQEKLSSKTSLTYVVRPGPRRYLGSARHGQGTRTKNALRYMPMSEVPASKRSTRPTPVKHVLIQRVGMSIGTTDTGMCFTVAILIGSATGRAMWITWPL